eukprot:15326699-Alexandrium_andersonii.AAC.1
MCGPPASTSSAALRMPKLEGCLPGLLLLRGFVWLRGLHPPPRRCWTSWSCQRTCLLQLDG